MTECYLLAHEIYVVDIGAYQSFCSWLRGFLLADYIV